MRDIPMAMKRNAGKAFAARVKAAFGTDAAVYPTRAGGLTGPVPRTTLGQIRILAEVAQ
jgi:hypothetical protein